MKYLTNFKNKSEYDSFKDSSNYIYPNVSYIEDSGSVINNSPQTQEKQVEITENGEITITPDAGFAYLNKVSVKTNVEGQGGSVGEGSGVVYYKVDPQSLGIELLATIMPVTINCVLDTGSTPGIMINCGCLAASMGGTILAIATAPQRIVMGGEDITLDLMGAISKFEQDMGVTVDRSLFVPITEEQYFDPNFYTA